VQEQGLHLAAATLGLSTEKLVVTGDERTALAGAFPQGEGIVVISGTGTIALGRNQAGRHHRCAGWGWLLDGAGSGMDIGRDALTLSLRMADGRHPDGPLRQALWQALGLKPEDPQSPQLIKARVVQPTFGPAGFAALAPVVEQLSAVGLLDESKYWRRVLIEKPFGTDLASAQDLQSNFEYLEPVLHWMPRKNLGGLNHSAVRHTTELVFSKKRH
jgi:hypothetical protein